jgi:hypothetical protein
VGSRGSQVIRSGFRRKEYLRRKNQGVSNVSEKELILSKSYQSVKKSLLQASLTYSKDNFRKFGDHVMLFNGKIEGFLGTISFIQSLTSFKRHRILNNLTIFQLSRIFMQPHDQFLS